jgi:hypothetical protein
MTNENGFVDLLWNFFKLEKIFGNKKIDELKELPDEYRGYLLLKEKILTYPISELDLIYVFKTIHEYYHGMEKEEYYKYLQHNARIELEESKEVQKERMMDIAEKMGITIDKRDLSYDPEEDSHYYYLEILKKIEKDKKNTKNLEDKLKRFKEAMHRITELRKSKTKIP